MKKNYFYIFFFSLIACLIFYKLERLLNISKFYHPDSIHYLKIHTFINFFDILNEDPALLFSHGYYFFVKFFNYNYNYLVILNFLLFSLTNVIIYSIFCKNFNQTSKNLKLLLLLLLLFFDPYRLHLSGHILKETILIFILILIIYFQNFFIRLFFIFLAMFFRKNIIFYLLLFINISLIKKYFWEYKNNLKYMFSTVLLLSILLVVFFDFFSDTSLNLIKTLEFWHFRDMGGRFYDEIPNYQNYDFTTGIMLKIFTWPILLLSGTFIFFTSSYIFKLLGVVIIIYNAVIFWVTKKTFISVGLILLIILISLYSSTFTSFFRYSYVALYISIVYFFCNQK